MLRQGLRRIEILSDKGWEQGADAFQPRLQPSVLACNPNESLADDGPARADQIRSGEEARGQVELPFELGVEGLERAQEILFGRDEANGQIMGGRGPAASSTETASSRRSDESSRLSCRSSRMLIRIRSR